MNSHCWRNLRLEGKKEKDKVWPEIQQSKNQRRKYDSQTSVRHHRSTDQNSAEPNSFANNFHQLETNLNYCDFPELGKIMSRRKNRFRKDPDAIVTDDVIIVKDEGDDKLKTRKYVKRSERSNLFRINIQQILENQTSLKNSLAEKKIKCCDRIVETKGSKIYFIKSKRPTKLKQLIINEREKQKEVRHKNHGPVIKISHEQLLSMETLKIVADPDLDLDCGRTLSGLNLIGNEYRDHGGNNSLMIDKIVENRKDISQRLEKLLISTNDETNMINDDLRHDIANIEISESNQNGIVDAVNRVLILNNQEHFQNPAFLTYRENTNNLRYSKKFREYCTNIILPSLNKELETFVSELFRLQKKLYERNNVKGKYKRRFYTGFNEVEKHINLKKIKFVIIVPDLEKVEIEGGLDDIVNKLIGSCRKQNIPIGFGLSRRKLGYLTHRRGMVSCIGISNFSNIEEKFEEVLNSLVVAKNEFRTLMGELNKLIDVKKIMDDDLLLSERIKILLKILASTT